MYDSASIFMTNLDSLEIFIGQDISGHTAGERLESLYEICDDRETAIYVDNFAQSLRNAATTVSQSLASSSDLKGILTQVLVADALSSMSFRFRESEYPKVHHWIPKCYLKNFGIVKRNQRKSIAVPVMTFMREQPIFGVFTDRSFAHSVNEGGQGFYHLAMERFFGLTESRFQFTSSTDKVTKKIYDAALMFIQSVRCPDLSSGFKGSSVAELMDKLIEVLDSFEKIHVTVGSTRNKTVVAPYFPSYLKKTVKYGLSAYFPITSDEAAMITEAPVTNNSDFNSFTSGARHALIKRSLKSQTPLIGLQNVENYV